MRNSSTEKQRGILYFKNGGGGGDGGGGRVGRWGYDSLEVGITN